MKIKSIKSNDGFTIVELMIALSILASILVMSTVIMMRIGTIYTKGVNAATLQNASRNISADITSAIQFSGSNPRDCTSNCNGLQVICVGSIRYTFITGRKLGTESPPNPPNPTSHVLWRDVMPNAAACEPVQNFTSAGDPSAGGQELIPENVRLVELDTVEVVPGTYRVIVRTAYGDSDLLNATRTGCVGTKGNEYCGASRVTTTVTRRIE